MVASLVFYGHLGWEVVGRVEADERTQLCMLALPGERDVSLELVHRATDGPVETGGLDHIAVQVDDLRATREALVAAGLRPSEVALPGGAYGPKTSEVVDPDGHRLELVQWPTGHPTGMTRDDFSDDTIGNLTDDGQGAPR
jgi:lactoylglutathione lyase